MIRTTFEDRVELLTKWGFEVKETECVFTHSVYHNDIEYETVVVWGVFKDGKPYGKPHFGYGSRPKNFWVDEVFENELNGRLLALIKTFV